MAVKRHKVFSFILFQRTDAPPSTHLLIFSHGVLVTKLVGGHATFPVPDKKRLHYYVPEGYAFKFSKDTLDQAFQGQYIYEDLLIGNGSVKSTDYDLSKAAKGGLKDKNLQKDYDDLDQYVNQSHATPNAIAARHANGLGLGVKCDVLSIRDRAVSSSINLSDVIKSKELAQYQDFHCFFCRAKDDNAPGRPPKK
jgi:hypothetical protein